MDTFPGIPDAAFRFHADLEHNNIRGWWLDHKATYDSAAKEPLTLLLAEPELSFGAGKLFRPIRDIRFSPDKSPYETAQGAFASTAVGVGYYLQLSAGGLLIGGGCHTHTPAQLSRFRSAVPSRGERRLRRSCRSGARSREGSSGLARFRRLRFSRAETYRLAPGVGATLLSGRWLRRWRWRPRRRRPCLRDPGRTLGPRRTSRSAGSGAGHRRSR